MRAVKQWNSLYPEVMSAPSLDVFRRRLDRDISEMIQGYLLWVQDWTKRLSRSFQP